MPTLKEWAKAKERIVSLISEKLRERNNVAYQTELIALRDFVEANL